VLQIVDYIAKNYSGKVVEVGIGYNWTVAKELKKRGFYVVATDIKPIDIDEIEFYIDNVMEPELKIYEGASLVYSIRPPPEIVPYIVAVANAVKADCLVRPFANDFYDGKLVNYKGEKFYIWKVVAR